MSDPNELSKNTLDPGAGSGAVKSAARPTPSYRPFYTSRYDHEAWEVAVRLPGVIKENVTVTVENEILEVRAKRSHETPEGWRPLGRYEPSRSYRLRLDVGPEVDESRISGGLEDGVLTLRLPLREEVKPRSIEIH